MTSADHMSGSKGARAFFRKNFPKQLLSLFQAETIERISYPSGQHSYPPWSSSLSSPTRDPLQTQAEYGSSAQWRTYIAAMIAFWSPSGENEGLSYYVGSLVIVFCDGMHG